MGSRVTLLLFKKSKLILDFYVGLVLPNFSILELHRKWYSLFGYLCMANGGR